MSSEDQIFIAFVGLCITGPLVLAGIGILLHTNWIIALVDFLWNFTSSLSEPYDGGSSIFDIDENNRVSLRQRLIVGSLLIIAGLGLGWFFISAI